MTMAQQVATSSANPTSALSEPRQAFVTAIIADQRIGIPISEVQDVLNKQKILHIPLARPAIVGALNLRGRIVTALDLRLCLGLEPCPEPSEAVSIVIEQQGELYSLLVDKIGDVAEPEPASFERNPSTLTSPWREICSGVYRLDNELMLSLDVPSLLKSVKEATTEA